MLLTVVAKNCRSVQRHQGFGLRWLVGDDFVVLGKISQNDFSDYWGVALFVAGLV